MSQSRLKAYLLMLSAAVIWGIASVVIKFTLKGIEPLPFLIYRFGISALIALPFLFRMNKKLKWDLKTLSLVLLYSLLSTTIALGLLFLGVDQTTVLNLALIAITAPLIIEIAGVVVFHERITKREKIGTLIAVAGAALSVAEPILEQGANIGSFYGNILLIGYLLADITSILILKKLLRSKHDINAEMLTHVSFVIGFVSLLPIAGVYFTPQSFMTLLSLLPLPYHLGVLYMAIFSGTIAYILRGKAQKTIEIGEAALFGYLTPLFSVPLAVVWLNETITPLFIIGALIITAGVFIAEIKAR